MAKRTTSKYYRTAKAIENQLVNSLDFKREFNQEIKLARKLWASKDFATNRKKQLELKRLGVAMDLKMLFQQMENALYYNDVKTYNSLALVFHEKYGKYLAAHEQGVVTIGESGVVILPEQKAGNGKQKKNSTEKRPTRTTGESG